MYPVVAKKRASERLKAVARGQSDEGAATPGEESRFVPKPQRGGSKPVPCRICCRPYRGLEMFYLRPRGRRFFCVVPAVTLLAAFLAYVRRPGP